MENVERTLEERSMENVTLKEQTHTYLKEINNLANKLEEFQHKEEQFLKAEENQHQIKNLQTSVNLITRDKEEAIRDKAYMETELEKIKNVMKQLKMEKDEKTKALISVSKGFDSARQVVTILSKEREILKQKITNLSNLLNEQKEQENG